jgi:hypothetical protein
MSNHFLLLHDFLLLLIFGGKYEGRVNLNRTSAKKGLKQTRVQLAR